MTPSTGHDDVSAMWRSRARELRAAAQRASDGPTKTALLELATNWDRMADGRDALTRGGEDLAKWPPAHYELPPVSGASDPVPKQRAPAPAKPPRGA
jgi:hypothetical protein